MSKFNYRCRWNSHTRRHLRKAVREGATVDEVAEELDMGNSTVRLEAKRLGLRWRNNKHDPLKDAEVIRLLGLEATLNEVAAAMEIDQRSVSKIAHRLNRMGILDKIEVGGRQRVAYRPSALWIREGEPEDGHLVIRPE